MCIHQNYMYVYLLLIHLLSLWTILWQYFRRFALFVRTENSFVHLSQTARSVIFVHVVHFFFGAKFFSSLFCCLRFVLLSGWCAWAIFPEKRFKGIKENRQLNEVEKNVITKGTESERTKKKKKNDLMRKSILSRKTSRWVQKQKAYHLKMYCRFVRRKRIRIRSAQNMSH